MSCGVGCRRGLDPALLWLWRRPVATAPIGPLAWEPPYATGTALEKAKKDKQTNKQTNKKTEYFVVKELEIQMGLIIFNTVCQEAQQEHHKKN